MTRKLESNTFDACFPDPPYGLRMDKWDEAVPPVEVWEELLRVCKPGAPLLAFGASQTYDRLGAAIRQAGWEVKTWLHWIYTQGFPKSKYIGRAIRRKLAARQRAQESGQGQKRTKRSSVIDGLPDEVLEQLAEQWEGWGTGLKPAVEPIVFAMKPLDGGYVENVIKWGCGGLWIEGNLVPYASDYDRKHQHDICKGSGTFFGGNGKSKSATHTPAGRFPANVFLDEATAAWLDEEYGVKPTASIGRCFHQPKATEKEKSLGLPKGLKNPHKAVKPIELCKRLARLLLPPKRETSRKILVPYAGTGSEVIGAVLAGWDHVHGIEIDESYVDIARHRLRYWRKRVGKE
jgi:site-specific DNA-methyltransferase (adenine-specific)